MDAAAYVTTVMAALAGFVVGVMLGLNGFAQPAASGVLGQSPRIKNLLWLFSGLLPVFVADLHRLGLPDGFPRFWPFAGYGLGALLGAVGAIGWMVRSITTSVQTFNQQHPSAPSIDAGDLQREYLTYGKARFEERWKRQRDAAEAVEERTRAATDIGLRETAITEEKRRIDLEADKVMARCVYAALAHLASPEADRNRSDGALIDTIIEAILSIVRVDADNSLVLRGSYMRYIPAAVTDATHIHERLLFTTDMPDRYIGYLELRRGGGLAVRNVVLPVAAEPVCTLPGAPEAVAVVGAAMMNIRQ